MKYESKEVGEELHIFTKTELFIVNLLEFFCVLLLFSYVGCFFYLQYEKVEAKNAIENGYELSLNGEKIKDANKSDIEDLNVMGIHNIEINDKLTSVKGQCICRSMMNHFSGRKPTKEQV